MLLLIALLFFIWSIADGYSAEAMQRDIDNRRARRREHEELRTAAAGRPAPADAGK